MNQGDVPDMTNAKKAHGGEIGLMGKVNSTDASQKEPPEKELRKNRYSRNNAKSDEELFYSKSSFSSCYRHWSNSHAIHDVHCFQRLFLWKRISA
jgi:hypothetical protein